MPERLLAGLAGADTFPEITGTSNPYDTKVPITAVQNGE